MMKKFTVLIMILLVILVGDILFFVGCHQNPPSSYCLEGGVRSVYPDCFCNEGEIKKMYPTDENGKEVETYGCEKEESGIGPIPISVSSKEELFEEIRNAVNEHLSE